MVVRQGEDMVVRQWEDTGVQGVGIQGRGNLRWADTVLLRAVSTLGHLAVATAVLRAADMAVQLVLDTVVRLVQVVAIVIRAGMAVQAAVLLVKARVTTITTMSEGSIRC